MILPKQSDLHLEQVVWLAQDMDNLFSDKGVQQRALVLLRVLVLLGLLVSLALCFSPKGALVQARRPSAQTMPGRGRRRTGNDASRVFDITDAGVAVTLAGLTISQETVCGNRKGAWVRARRLRPAGTSAITYIVVHEREPGLIGS